MNRLQTFFSLVILTTSHVGAQQAQLPDRVARLKDSYLAAIDRATQPLTATYLAELTKLKLEFTRSGDLQGALAIEAEINRLDALQEPNASPIGTDAPSSAKRLKAFKSKEEFTQWLANTKWKAANGKGINFKADGKSFAFVDEKTNQETGAAYPITVLEIGIVTFQWTSGPTSKISFSEDLRTCSDGSRDYERVKE
jgi:hypothetical protein